MFTLSLNLEVDKTTKDKEIGEIETETMIEAIKMIEEIETTIEGMIEIESPKIASQRRSGSPITVGN